MTIFWCGRQKSVSIQKQTPPNSHTSPYILTIFGSMGRDFQIPSKTHESTLNLLHSMSEPEKIRILRPDPPPYRLKGPGLRGRLWFLSFTWLSVKNMNIRPNKKLTILVALIATSNNWFFFYLLSYCNLDLHRVSRIRTVPSIVMIIKYCTTIRYTLLV